MLFRSLLGAFGALCLVAPSLAGSSAGSSVLVLLEPKLKQDDYSVFFDGLRSRGYELTFRSPKDESPKMLEHDIPAFSHVIVFAPTTKAIPEDMSTQAIVSAISSTPGVNFLIALSPSTSPFNALAGEFSLILPPPHTPLISHFPHRPPPHTTLPVPLPASPHKLLRKSNAPILFSGISHALTDNPLLVPILNAPAESFASDSDSDKGADSVVEAFEKGGEGLWAGSKMGVVTGFQTRTSSRVTWIGGVSMFSNEFMNGEVAEGEKSGNEPFAEDVTAWTFKESLVIRADNATHYRTSDKTQTPMDRYTINDHVTFALQLSTFDAEKNTWVPLTDVSDMQLDFTMLDPHIRTALIPSPEKPGHYSVSFRVPDRHGVFKFLVDYRRNGYTPIHVSLPVSVVPPRHNEYPRFLSSAWPYYAGAISTSAAFILFCFIYMGDVVAERKAKRGQKKE